MSRSFINRGVRAALLAAAGGIVSIASSAFAQTVPDSVTIVPGSFIQGTVKTSLQAAGYTNTSMNLAEWPLNTGGNYAINFYNPQYLPNTLIAFGNGGGLTLQFQTPITPVTGDKDIGIFTAQAITNGAYALQGNYEATILVSSDNVHWFGLNGVSESVNYSGVLGDGTTFSLNAPTMAYNYGTWDEALLAGESKLSVSQLAALPIANYTTPMPNDAVFNTDPYNSPTLISQRNTLSTDTVASDYAADFGTSGGGNWFEVDDSGLNSIDYIRLNGDSNDPSSGGVRLEDVFANSNAVPEPTTLILAPIAAVVLLRRRVRYLRLT